MQRTAVHLWPQHAQTHTRLWLRLLRLPKYSREKTSRSGHQGGPACGSPASERPAALTNGRGPEGAPRSRWALPARRPRGRRRKAGTHSVDARRIDSRNRDVLSSEVGIESFGRPGGVHGWRLRAERLWERQVRRAAQAVPLDPPRCGAQAHGVSGGLGGAWHLAWHGLAPAPSKISVKHDFTVRVRVETRIRVRVETRMSLMCKD